MGPRRRPSRVKKGKAKGKKAKKPKEVPVVVPYVSEKEQFLQKEYAILTEHINTYTQRVRNFQWENELLDKEAQHTKETSKVYISYLNRRALRNQNAIISLNDQNRYDLLQIQKQKAQLVAQYTEREKEVRHQLMEREAKLSLINKELEILRPFQELHQEQVTRIRELERELLLLRVQYAEQSHKLKSQFLLQTAAYKAQAQQKVQALAKRAEKEAVRVLIQHTKQLKADHWRLRNQLLTLLKESQGLKDFLLQLKEQQHQLLQEHQYKQDLARIRTWLRSSGARLVITSGSSFRCTPSTRISPSPTAKPTGRRLSIPQISSSALSSGSPGNA